MMRAIQIKVNNESQVERSDTEITLNEAKPERGCIYGRMI